MKLKIKKLKPDAILPAHQREGDAAIDLHAVEDKLLKPNTVEHIMTGIAMEIPRGYVGNVRDRGGLAAKHAIHTLAGIFDSNYRGDITIVIINLGQEDYQVKKGDRIAQMLIHQVAEIEVEEISELSETNRGDNKFGSSGY